MTLMSGSRPHQIGRDLWRLSTSAADDAELVRYSPPSCGDVAGAWEQQSWPLPAHMAACQMRMLSTYTASTAAAASPQK